MEEMKNERNISATSGLNLSKCDTYADWTKSNVIESLNEYDLPRKITSKMKSKIISTTTGLFLRVII